MILWGNEHQARAEALAKAYHETSAGISSLSRGSEGITASVSDDATLSIWGHGDATHFSEMMDVECGLLICNWKAKNKNLKNVELITCDAQHNIIPLAGYARRVLAFITDRKVSVSIKAMPVGQHADDCSILWANAVTATFSYITAPSQQTFAFANQRLQTIEPSNGFDLAITSAELAKERSLTAPKNFTVNGGAFNVLRATLGEVVLVKKALG